MAEAQTLTGVKLVWAPAAARYSLRARTPQAMSQVIGRKVPSRIGEVTDGVACLGPDEWYALLPEGTELPLGAGLPVSVTDISSRAVGIAVSGPRAAQVIGAGCPQDLAAMKVGAACRTVFETVEMVLWRTGDESFHIEVWRSFSPWLWTALNAASSDLR